MDTAEIAVLVGGVLLIAFTLWFFFGARDDEPRTSTDGPIYACPMHPWITSSDPTANCSICGMKLVRTDEVQTSAEVEPSDGIGTSDKAHTPMHTSQPSHTLPPSHTHHH